MAREVFEESGIRVRNVLRGESQPWPFPQPDDVFTADYESGEIKVQDELAGGRRFLEADRLPRLPPGHHSAAAYRADAERDPLTVLKSRPLFAPLHIFALGRPLRHLWAALSLATPKWYHVRHFMREMTQELG